MLIQLPLARLVSSYSGDKVWWTRSLRSPGASDFVPVDGAASRSMGSVVRVVEGSGEKFVSTVYEVS